MRDGDECRERQTPLDVEDNPGAFISRRTRVHAPASNSTENRIKVSPRQLGLQTAVTLFVLSSVMIAYVLDVYRLQTRASSSFY